MPILSIRHVTRYRYRNPVALGEHRMMFRPHESYDQQVLSVDLAICPTPRKINYLRDIFGNCIGVAQFEGRTTDLVFDSFVRLDHRPTSGLADLDEGDLAYGVQDTDRFAYADHDLFDLAASIQPTHPDPEGAIEAWARRFAAPGVGALPLLVEMTQAIYADFNYRKRLESGVQTPTETLTHRSGSCRDYAVLMIDAVRRLGLAARFVSGYVYSPTRYSRGRVGGGHTHAWVSVYLPAHGWVEFDPTNGIVGNTDLIRVAVARDPSQAVPLHGSWSGVTTDYLGMEVSVDVQAEEEPALARRRLVAVG